MNNRIVSFVVANLAFLAAAAAIPGMDYINSKTIVVARDVATIPGSVIVTYRKGSATWAETNTLKTVNGAVQTDPIAALQKQVAAITPPLHYSKLRIIVAAKTAGKWDAVKSFIATNGLTDEWDACVYITPDNAYFISATNAVVASGLTTAAELKTFLANCVDK